MWRSLASGNWTWNLVSIGFYPPANQDRYNILYTHTYIIYIYTHIYTVHIPTLCIYGPAGVRQPPPCYPPQQPPTGVAIHLPPSIKISYAHMLYLNAGLVPPIHYITGYLHAVFATAYNMPIQSIYNVLLPMKYLCSSHILATIKISCAIHTC